MYCKKCGKKMEENMNFCPQCGNFVNMSQPVQVKKEEKKPTSIGTRIFAVFISLISILFLCAPCAKFEVDWYFTYVERVHITDMASTLEDFADVHSYLDYDDENEDFEKCVAAAAFGGFVFVIGVIAHIVSGIAALINSKNSGGIREAACIASLITIALSQYAVWNVEDATGQVVESTGIWILLLIITLIDMKVIAKLVGVKREEAMQTQMNATTETHLTKYLSNGEWKCPDCGRTNAEYIQTCACGKGRA
jgi:hypothetical protein